MGNKHSVINALPTNSVFEKELNGLNQIITAIINDDNTFKSKNYNFKDKNACNGYSLLLESSLKRHLKVELKDLKDSIYLVPNKDIVNINEKYLSKDNLCDVIAKHYETILDLLVLIKSVYDIEHNGDNSLAGITIRNIQFRKGQFMEINYCDTAQKDRNMQSDRTKSLDFSELQGLKLFTEKILSTQEKNALMRNIKNIFGKKNLNSIAEIALCGDDLLSGDDYKILFEGISGDKIKCNKDKAKVFDDALHSQDHDLFVTVVRENPILHTELCGSKQKLLIPLNQPTKEIKDLLAMFTRMKTDYVKNLNSIINIAKQLVETSDNGKTFVLKHIDNSTLETLRQQVKRNIAMFYLQSILNYHRLFNKAKTLPNSILNWEDER